jgi:hypothetical protein
MQVDVFLGTGVSVELPKGVDPETDDGYQQIKELAITKFRDLIDTGCFDVDWYELDQEG